MNSDSNSPVRDEDAASRNFYARAIPRMLRIMLVAGMLLLPFTLWFAGLPGTVGFAAGAVVSWINFRALVRGVEGLTERVVNRQSREKGGIIVGRFVVRYALVAAVAYVIFVSSKQAFRGFLCGLCLPVVAMMAEAVAEAYAAFRQSDPQTRT
jgi:hypothetical protein